MSAAPLVRFRPGPDPRLPAALQGVLQLLILQPTPFCNLDCRYCYLPDRRNPARMSPAVLATAIGRVAASGVVGRSLSVVWHAGEPMVLPAAWYREAMGTVAAALPAGCEATHHFQTNGTLIDDDWCELLRRPDVHVGLSIDGPAWLHDRQRVDRRGRGTHAAVLRGADRLRAAGIPFHVICVLSRAALDHPDAILDFFLELGPSRLCFNVEEIEAAHGDSSLAEPDAEAAFRRFFARVVARYPAIHEPLPIREIDEVVAALRHPRFGSIQGNSQNERLRILSVDHLGCVGTYSPELLGGRHPRYGELGLGDLSLFPLATLADAPRARRIDADIDAGRRRCREACRYFDFCLGGAPANKLAELGSLDGTETMFCRFTRQIVVDCVLDALEAGLAAGRMPF